ncbi:MAG: undecaprenyl/decaprenyl-phosphate alpha-N-acetylglucosaminyl 1-phosphate transferase, partial [Desulfobacterales bacterium]|nr:undecaprenyl/decaprenyl-phosphate alpha-N-acetylglucosaminyl 1-phosphate transferase [Desulfobacterales bacterium]
ITIFCISLALSLILTPLVTKLLGKYHLMDMPAERKVHESPIPRAGGIAICLAFYLPFALMMFYRTNIFDLVFKDPRVIFIVLGSLVAFGLGLWDDIRRLRPRLKFTVQIVVALSAYVGGIRIEAIGLPGMPFWHLGWLSLPATVFWILLVINAINFSDGLDGLAAGVSFFVCIILLILSVLGEEFLTALGLAALGGAILGFLRYNFNPATVFMGDCGSYFLGYMLASLSILGSLKTQAAVTILIPMIAMGIPLMDVIWSAARRFLSGKRLFDPDDAHFHHKLLKLGLTQRKSVLILYAATIGMGAFAFFLVYARDERAALLLLLVGVALIFGILKLGYLNYFSVESLIWWARGFSDEVGLTRERRSFFNLQSDIIRSSNIQDLWQNITHALEVLEFDKGSLYMNISLKNKELKDQTRFVSVSNSADLRLTSPIESSVIMRKSRPELDWVSPPFEMENYVCSRSIFRLEAPLVGKNNAHLGTLVLVKDMKNKSIDHLILRRAEDLRRAIIRALEKLDNSPDS